MGNPATIWRHRTGEIVLDRTRVMGILNVTPDSFSDGGRYFDPEAALRHGLDLVDMGADLVDIGGESTRPGSDPVPAEEEWRRVGPVIRGLAARSRAGVVAMHMLGNPKTMQEHPAYADVVGEVRSFLTERIRILEGVGVASEAIAVDPGVGFGKTPDHNLSLLRHLDQIIAL